MPDRIIEWSLALFIGMGAILFLVIIIAVLSCLVIEDCELNQKECCVPCEVKDA